MTTSYYQPPAQPASTNPGRAASGASGTARPKILRSTDPAIANKPKKVMFYGKPGTGKTSLALEFPRPLLLINLEQGGDPLAAATGLADFDIVDASEWSEVIGLLEDIRSRKLKSLAGAPYASVVLDGLDKIYYNLLSSFMERNEHGQFVVGRNKPWFPVKHNWKWFGGLLTSLPCNVVCTCHSREEVEVKGANQWIKSGNDQPDLDESILYDFDLVLEMFRNQGTTEFYSKISPFKLSRSGNIAPGQIIKNTNYNQHLMRIFGLAAAQPAASTGPGIGTNSASPNKTAASAARNSESRQPAQPVQRPAPPEEDPEEQENEYSQPLPMIYETISEGEAGADLGQAVPYPLPALALADGEEFDLDGEMELEMVPGQASTAAPLPVQTEPGPKALAFLEGYKKANSHQEFVQHTARRNRLDWTKFDQEFLTSEASRLYKEKGLTAPPKNTK